MLELNVNSKSPAAINGAFKKIKEMVTSGAVSKTTPVHVVLEPGTYREIIKYNMSNPLIMECVPGSKAEDCVVQAQNCEAFNKGLENRGVFYIGPNATNVTLKNFSVVNTHVKANEGIAPVQDSAEAFVWNNTTGTLFAEKMIFDGRQNTLHVKGNSWFMSCNVIGDVDFIYGEPETAYFENCRIHLRDDNRGDMPGFAVKPQVIAEKPGFIFSECRFTCDKRKKSELYVFRTEGKGSASSAKGWDSAALVNCLISDFFSLELIFDDDMNLEVFPRGNAVAGIREYNTRVVTKNGKVEEADTSRRNIKSYTLTEDDYFHGYASRYLMLHDTPFSKTE